MLQMDGSIHVELDGWAPACVLMVIVDNATSQTYASFYPAETPLPALMSLGGGSVVLAFPGACMWIATAFIAMRNIPRSPRSSSGPSRSWASS
jgi:hypothetical protein